MEACRWSSASRACWAFLPPLTSPDFLRRSMTFLLETISSDGATGGEAARMYQLSYAVSGTMRKERGVEMG